MMSPKSVITSTLKVGVVYKIEAPELITTSVPHYFVVIAIDDDDNFLALSTTQLEKKIEHLNRRGYDLDTLAHISPNTHNGLSKNSYFNCNEYYEVNKNGLIAKVQQQKLSVVGNFSEEEYDKIVDAILLSRINDIPKYLLKYS